MLFWIVQTGEPLHCDNQNDKPMRAMNLANSLIKLGHQVVIISSSFNHQKKVHRTSSTEIVDFSLFLKIILIHSPGYKKNISIQRFYDHILLARNLKFFLEKSNLQLPDAAIIGFPPIEFAFVISNWLKQRNIFTVLDLKDRWPEVFVSVFPKILQPILNSTLYPLYRLRRQIFINVSSFTSISNSYIKWMNNLYGIAKPSYVIPLTNSTSRSKIQEYEKASIWWNQFGIDLEHKYRIIFVGTLSRAFDFKLIENLADFFISNQISIEIIICGNGPKLIELQSRFKRFNFVHFSGWIDKPKLDVLMNSSSFTIAPYKNTPDFIDSIPNKILDSLSYGLPIITTLEGEVKQMIEKHNIGFFLDEKSITRVGIELINYMNDPFLFKQMSNRCSSLYNEKFEFNKVYNYLVSILKSGCEKK